MKGEIGKGIDLELIHERRGADGIVPIEDDDCAKGGGEEERARSWFVSVSATRGFRHFSMTRFDRLLSSDDEQKRRRSAMPTSAW